MRRTRNYKGKSTGLTFGHFALPIAAVIALGLLFAGIKLFFLSPPKPAGITVTHETFAFGTGVYDSPAPLIQEPDFTLADDVPLVSESPVSEFTAAEPEQLEMTDVEIVLAGPLTARGTPAASSGKNTTRANTGRAAPAASAKTTNAGTTKPSATPAVPPRTNTTAPANSKWAVQIGAFVNADSAAALVSEAKRQGYSVSVSKADSSGKTFHRVRVSAGSTREDANRLAAELERKGYPVSVVPMS
jgi:DedD protein